MTLRGRPKLTVGARMGRITLTLAPDWLAALQRIADSQYEGNRSRAVREMIKSGITLGETKRGGAK